MKTAVVLVVLIVHCAHLIIAEVDDGLDGPLPDPNAELDLLGHGIHCVEVMEKCIDGNVLNETDATSMDHELTVMHCYHCQRNIQLIKRFQDANPDFSVEASVCSVLSKPRFRRLLAHWLYLGAQRKRRDVKLSEEDLLEKEKTKNLAKLLLKEYRGATLTVQEAKYIQALESVEAVIGATKGLFCNRGSIIAKEHISELVRQSHGICW